MLNEEDVDDGKFIVEVEGMFLFVVLEFLKLFFGFLSGSEGVILEFE